MHPRRCIAPDMLQAQSAGTHLGRDAGCPVAFVQGDSEALPFPNGSFDVVINVESSHTYPHFDRFAAEVWRVLRTNGTFLITDFG